MTCLVASPLARRTKTVLPATSVCHGKGSTADPASPTIPTAGCVRRVLLPLPRWRCTNDRWLSRIRQKAGSERHPEDGSTLTGSSSQVRVTVAPAHNLLGTAPATFRTMFDHRKCLAYVSRARKGMSIPAVVQHLSGRWSSDGSVDVAIPWALKSVHTSPHFTFLGDTPLTNIQHKTAM